MTSLSMLTLNLRDLNVLRDLADPYEMHRTVMRAFPEADSGSARERFQVLYRLEVSRSSAALLVQSNAEPDWKRLPSGVVLDSRVKAIDKLLAACDEGRRLRFRLVANPIKNIGASKGDAGRSRRVPLVGEEAQIDWLDRRAALSGFRLVDAAGAIQVQKQPDVVARPQRRREAIRIVPVRFDGRLEITDAEKFQSVTRSGIGRGKAFGCGLLSLAPSV